MNECLWGFFFYNIEEFRETERSGNELFMGR